jgi:hypothetical protein
VGLFHKRELQSTVMCKLTDSVAQEPEGSSPHSQQPATGPCPEPVISCPFPVLRLCRPVPRLCVVIRNKY